MIVKFCDVMYDNFPHYIVDLQTYLPENKTPYFLYFMNICTVLVKVSRPCDCMKSFSSSEFLVLCKERNFPMFSYSHLCSIQIIQEISSTLMSNSIILFR